MKPNRNDVCPCGSNKKFKNCCIELHNERSTWDELEDALREKVDEYWEEFYYDRYVDQALATYGKELSCDMSDIGDRRLFIDWFIHDYVIPDKKDTIINLFIKDCKNKLIDEQERNTAMAWSKSEFRFYEILEIKRGTGYEVKDIFNDAGNNIQFFVFDKSSSEKVNKYDIQYMRVYQVGRINTITGVGILMPRRYLAHIRDYISHSLKLFNKKDVGRTVTHGDVYYHYFKKESLSILKYLHSVEINPTVTTPQGDAVVLSKCRYAIKNKKGLISLLDSSRQFVRLENEGKRTIRFDWVQKINKKDLVGTVTDSMGLDKHLSLNTLLWMPSPNQTGDKDNGKEFISKINDKRDDVDEEPFTAYRVLGNLSITGSELIIECLSDKLLENCNNAIRLLADEYISYLDNSYTELSCSMKAIRDNNKSETVQENRVSYDDDDSIRLEIPPTLKRQINDYFQSYYKDWINMNIPALGGQTPLEVARTDSGKDLLRELLKEIENEGDLNVQPPFPVDRIRKQLCL